MEITLLSCCCCFFASLAYKFLIGSNVLNIHKIFEISLCFSNGAPQIPWKWNNLFCITYSQVHKTLWKSFNWSWWNKLLVSMQYFWYENERKKPIQRVTKLTFNGRERKQQKTTVFNRMETICLEDIKQMVEYGKVFPSLEKKNERRKKNCFEAFNGVNKCSKKAHYLMVSLTFLIN